MPTTTASDLPFYNIFAPQKLPVLKISDDVIACDLGPPIKNPGYAYGVRGFYHQPNSSLRGWWVKFEKKSVFWLTLLNSEPSVKNRSTGPVKNRSTGPVRNRSTGADFEIYQSGRVQKILTGSISGLYRQNQRVNPNFRHTIWSKHGPILTYRHNSWHLRSQPHHLWTLKKILITNSKITTTIKNPSFCAVQLRNNILLKSFPILLILI